MCDKATRSRALKDCDVNPQLMFRPIWISSDIGSIGIFAQWEKSNFAKGKIEKLQLKFFIVVFLENANSLESVCVYVCVCPFLCVCMCVCVFLHDNSKRN